MEIKKHYFIFKDKKIRYLCNQAVDVSEDKITNDYFKVTCKNCKDILERQIMKVPVGKRTQGEHMVLIIRFGGVRNYLLTMGDFKDDNFQENTQPNTPTTNPKGETKSGKINKGFTEGHLEDDTTGVETRRSLNDALNVKGVKDGS